MWKQAAAAAAVVNRDIKELRITLMDMKYWISMLESFSIYCLAYTFVQQCKSDQKRHNLDSLIPSDFAYWQTY